MYTYCIKSVLLNKIIFEHGDLIYSYDSQEIAQFTYQFWLTSYEMVKIRVIIL